jgi:hypothetical protein
MGVGVGVGVGEAGEGRGEMGGEAAQVWVVADQWRHRAQ